MATRAALIGAGRIAAFHVQGYQRAGAEIVAIADVDEERAREHAAPIGARAYTDYRSMLDREQPDAVSICTPPYLHAEQVIAVAQAGAAILAEKPFALTVTEAREMLVQVRAAGVVLAVNFAHRFYEPTERVGQLLRDGLLGQVHTFHVRFGVDYTQSERQWIFKKELAGGGAFMDTASHGVDLFRFLVGEVDQVFAVAKYGRPEWAVEDLGVLVVEHAATGAVGTVEADWRTPGADYRWSIHGTGGAAYVGYFDPTLRYRLAGEAEWTDVPIELPARNERFDRVVTDFLTCAAGRGVPRATGDDGIRALEIVAAAYTSAESGRAVACGPAVSPA